MTIKAQASALTATGDTTKTSIDTITIPKGVKRIVGIWCYAAAAAAMTTAEAISGIVEFESSDVNLVPLQLPLDIISALTSGSVAISPRIFPANILVNGGERIQGYVTMDMAQTSALKARFGLIYETQ